MIIFWPFLMLLQRFISTRRSAIATAEEKFRMKSIRKEDLIISARAQIIEVSIEASFQPLLQLYMLLPGLLQFQFYEVHDFLGLFEITEIMCSFEKVQFWAILKSIISLSWSFTFYQAMQKNGALDFGSNLGGRLLLLFANLFQIASRLLALILYAYVFGDGMFWPMILSVQLHIILMSILHYFLSDEWSLKNFKNKPHKIAYHCLINGICNLYLHNWIVQIEKTEDQSQKEDQQNKRSSIRKAHKRQTKKDGTSFRQLMFDSIFVVENVIILVLVKITFNEVLPPNLLVFIAFSQYIGIALKCLYYAKFHIWSTSFDRDSVQQQTRESSKNFLTRIKRSIKFKDIEEYENVKKENNKEEDILKMSIKKENKFYFDFHAPKST